MEWFEIKNGDGIDLTIYRKDGEGKISIEIEIDGQEEPNDHIVSLYPSQIENLITFLTEELKNN